MEDNQELNYLREEMERKAKYLALRLNSRMIRITLIVIRAF
jgi:hypothetical protein